MFSIALYIDTVYKLLIVIIGLVSAANLKICG